MASWPPNIKGPLTTLTPECKQQPKDGNKKFLGKARDADKYSCHRLYYRKISYTWFSLWHHHKRKHHSKTDAHNWVRLNAARQVPNVNGNLRGLVFVSLLIKQKEICYIYKLGTLTWTRCIKIIVRFNHKGNYHIYYSFLDNIMWCLQNRCFYFTFVSLYGWHWILKFIIKLEIQLAILLLLASGRLKD